MTPRWCGCRALKALEGDAAWQDKIMELMDAVDAYIPEPERDLDKPFLMPIEDVFTISGRGTVVTGKVEQGIVKVGEEVEIVGLRPTQKTVCTGVEMFRKLLDQGQAGDNMGALLRGTKKEEVERGQVLCKPGSITPHTNFEAQVYVLTKEEGGRHKPFFNNYRPQFYFRTTDVTGSITLPEGTEMVMPGDNTTMAVELGKPIAMDEGLRFAIREGGRTVGAGRVTKIIKSSRIRDARRPPPEAPVRPDHRLNRRTPVPQRIPRMAKNEKRVKVTLACEQCKRRNYITMKNKQNDRERIEMKKYCRWDRTHTLHKETARR